MSPNREAPHSCPSIATACALIVCVVINLAFSIMDYVFIKNLESLGELRRLPYPGELPIELWPVAQRTFKHENYHLDAEEEWESVFPNGYSLGKVPLNITSQQSSLMTVPSLYNELWCLNHLRQIYMDPGWKDDQCKDRQVHRCLNLVRQAILCSADTSLEPVVLVKLSHGTERATTGINVLHVCRDWNKVREATERRYQQSQGRATEGFNW